MTAIGPELAKNGELQAAPRPFTVPWRDPQSVSPQELQECIASLKAACAQDPVSADLRTCLAMAHAMNYDVHRSFDALEEARLLEPQNFWAQQKYAELLYRVRALGEAETQSKRALELAVGNLEIAVARKLLSEIRQKFRDGTQKPAWTRSLFIPAALLAGLAGLTAIAGFFQ